jgi:hypothetical protein
MNNEAADMGLEHAVTELLAKAEEVRALGSERSESRDQNPETFAAIDGLISAVHLEFASTRGIKSNPLEKPRV